MLQAALASGTAHRRSRLRALRPTPAGRARYGVVAGVGRALDAIEALPVRRPRRSTSSAEHESSTGHPRVARRLRFTGDIWGYPEGEFYFPGSRCWSSSAPSPRASCWRRCCCHLQPRLGDRLGRLADDRGRRGPALHRDGLPAHPRAGRRRGGPGGVHRRLRGHLQPGGRPALRRARPRHRRARVHPAARHRARRVRGPDRSAGRGHHPAGGHLRRRRGGPARGRARRRRLGAVRLDSGDLRRPGRTGPRAAGLARRDHAPRSW